MRFLRPPKKGESVGWFLGPKSTAVYFRDEKMFEFSMLLSVAKGAAPVSEAEFNLFKKAMGEQGEYKTSTQDVIANAAKKHQQLDAWGASGGMPRIPQQ